MPPSAPRKQRLTRSADFDRVFRQGRSAQHRLLVMYRFQRPDDMVVLKNEGGTRCRLGITVSKKVGGAVERNRIKRQLREAAAAAQLTADDSDLVLIARPGLVEAVDKQGFDSLVELVTDLGERLKVVQA